MNEQESCKILVRIVNVDYYLSKPVTELNDPCYSGFMSVPITYVPVVRIYGPTATGVKTCVHIHGVFPYIFVPNWNSSIGEKELYQFAIILDKAINTSFANSSAKTCHIYRITAVLGRPFYGYYEEEKQFLKIEFFNPAIVKRAADLLLNGAIFGTVFQPHEAHVPYILQFFIDNNLYGMNYIALSSYSIRCSDETGVELDQNMTKQSYCALEIDAAMKDIVNVHQNIEDMPNNPGLAFIWEEEKRRRRIHKQSSQIALTLSQDRPEKCLSATESYFKTKFADKLFPHKHSCSTYINAFSQESLESESEKEELNTQSRSVLSLLEKLMQEKEDEGPFTLSRSPSVIFSDDEEELFVECSQPVLKLPVENDSILGDQFSDNEADDIDHFVFSQSLAGADSGKWSSSDESDARNYSNIPQLDGATSPMLPRRCNARTNFQSKKAYNLRSKKKNNAVISSNSSTHSSILESKLSPRKQYPQLKIDTQKSPKSVAIQQTSPQKEHMIHGTPPSSSNSFKDVTRLSVPQDDGKTDSKRLYPQLSIDIKKSPKTIFSKEDRKFSSESRKRKINFNDEEVLPNASSFDMTSVTVKWKKQRPKLSAPLKEQFNSCSFVSDLSSQKFSLKIDSTAEEPLDKLHNDLLLRTPIVKLKRIDSNLEQKHMSRSDNESSSIVLEENDIIKLKNSSSQTVAEQDYRKHNNQTKTSNLPLTETRNHPILSNKMAQNSVQRKRLGLRMSARNEIGKCTKKSNGANACANHDETKNVVASDGKVIIASPKCNVPEYSVEGNKSEKYSINFSRENSSKSFSNLEKQCVQSTKNFNEYPSKSAEDETCSISNGIMKNSSNEINRERRSKMRGKPKVLKKSTNLRKFSVRQLPSRKDEKIYGESVSENKSSVGESETSSIGDLDSYFEITDSSIDRKTVNFSESFIDENISKLTFNHCSNFEKTNESKNFTSNVPKSFNSKLLDSDNCSNDDDNDIGKTSTFNAQVSNRKGYVDQNHSSSFSRLVDVDESKSLLSDVHVILETGNNNVDSNTSRDFSGLLGLQKCQTIDKSVKHAAVDSNCSMDDEEMIDKIAFNIIRQTMSSGQPSSCGNEIKFTEVSGTEFQVFGETEQNHMDMGKIQETNKDFHFINYNDENVVPQCSANVIKLEHYTHFDDEKLLNEEVPLGNTTNTSVCPSVGRLETNKFAITEKLAKADEDENFKEFNFGDFPVVYEELEKNSTLRRKFLTKESNYKHSICIADNTSNKCNVMSKHKSPEDKATSSEEIETVITAMKKFSNEKVGIKDRKPTEQLHCSEPIGLLADNENLSSLIAFDSRKLSKIGESLVPDQSLDIKKYSPAIIDEIKHLPNDSQNETNKFEHIQVHNSPTFSKRTVDVVDKIIGARRCSASDAEISPMNCFKMRKLFPPSSLDDVNKSISQSAVESKAGCAKNDGTALFLAQNSHSVKSDPSSSVKKMSAACSFSSKPVPKIDFQFDNSIWYSSDDDIDNNQVYSIYKDESLDELVSDVSLPRNSQSPVFVSQISKNFLSDDSPTCAKGGRHILHSTPTQKKSKKSPSPTYTPIYKKLMMKVLSGEEKNGRTESYMENIEEEFDGTKSVNVSLNSLNDSVSKLGNDQNKSCNNSGTIASVGSGRIDTTMNDTYGFKIGLENLQDVKADVQFQFITAMSMELFVETRRDLRPDPEFDSITGVFYSIFHDAPDSPGLLSGMIIVDSNSSKLDLQKFSCSKHFVQNEDELFNILINIIRKYDPDIFVGYEIEMLSWGYLIQRGQYRNRNCCLELSRVKESKVKEFREKSFVEDVDYSNEFKLIGRIVLNVWRLMRHEIALQCYSFENIMFHVMHQRIPQYSFQTLTEWWNNALKKWLVVDYHLFRAENNILILRQLDFFGRTSELAKIFGIQFYEVLSRGSQFRVESMMLRLAKTQNFVAVSPSPRQRAKMRAPESLPLIMEPESKYYREPVIVLDFQSLYPSIIIAYNYCFSTCLGRVQHLVNNETFELGCTQHTVPIDLLLKLESSLNFSPCGVAFVNKNVRRGILPAMLEEILETRLIVKKSMKENKSNSILQRVLHARQLGLKLIANVTYGYTSANFSGRMPCIEVGDSVVSKGRETLERAIEMISANENWEAKVIYGDTDSLFVMVPGRNKEEAFRIGSEIVNAVTQNNPKPVKLKLEKVYYPCILQTKKRYVGYMYESADQKEPVYDAKGIETVRRDGCPAMAKILEKSLKLLFETNDVNSVKYYVQRQFSKLMAGRLSIQELTFAREYRGMNNYKPAACVPALQLAKQALLKDRRSEPRVKERVRYVLTAGPPGVPLIKLVRTPEQFLNSPGCLINVEYYITRAIIPAMERCFALIDVNVLSWYVELPRRKQFYLPVQSDLQNRLQKKTTIFQYFTSSKCISCGAVTVSNVCMQCEKKPQQLAIILGNLINSWQRKHNYISKICRSCSQHSGAIECLSLDCPIYYVRRQALRDVEQVNFVEELQQKNLQLDKNIALPRQKTKRAIVPQQFLL